MTLPADSHVHSEWSWDTRVGSMEGTCERAVAIGLPALAFTEHVDHTSWPVPVDGPYASPELTAAADADGILHPPAFDAEGYLAAVERCRDRFPGLRILTGLEIGEPHWYAEQCARILSAGTFDRVLGSLHCLPDGAGFAEPWALFPHRDPAALVREYLAEIPRMVAGDDPFTVLAHIDYPLRSWPAEKSGPFDPALFEDDFRYALRATAESGRALEINTRIPMDATILRWWHEEGGRAVSFGSDAHRPELVANGFREATAMADAFGFRPGRTPWDLWPRA
ncbi:histidinol phosphatase [Actinoplanes sp. SE50]|uniref:PHP domain-containing protein n=1 Tax=unclassified Actinoplanes TaxID=2626549 RepID=UPI00023EC4A1|nr:MULTISPECIES: PHP domain-containing protein [unclassified Actinoplanes]AEV85269.1 histidinol-phosphatase (PHP family) [Actinoplanes sp. SE50/110]ATO83664.1 histidinol phosphatase [Actinoplanes sp. SE50]SLM01072.1 histidinol-phosphatase [Actinoplanes sp. SE50/110]